MQQLLLLTRLLTYIHIIMSFKIVEQIPIIQYNRQPTVAIITAEYCEKVAVDTLIENKETFVRYTTVGKNTTWQLVSFFFFFIST